MKIFSITAGSFEGRIPCRHEFDLPGDDEDDVLQAIQLRWPELYDIKIEVKQ